ncbi:DUF1549 and DUF1553 domain-containing protein [Luteolibacter flavescens]|uniref:DUF1549 and DUF1553 domain-containing protein n=1 Tax=Luteolibacter flavescens TaxID=1859460 RepID=A0ABT3FUP3_9BACT|nr:DUF1549 and DUF1553 domain-containing protein [Luteolibacter flavescens]MCW1887267.1 DUF1549 and DUF1553 domain-containing protein [Luteolibacter flavescens]
MRFSLVLLALLSCATAEEKHWAYVPPVKADVAGHPVDALLAKAWERSKLQPAKPAAPRQWLERAAFTLTGLAPTDEQLRRIEASPDDATWRALIDELLASPAYGERWARHWMDVARYADTRGYNFDQDNRYPFAYTYRNWLIKAFNDDLPYDRFVKLQIAADLLVDRPDHPDLAALGFLTVGLRGGPVETIDDRVDVVTRGFLSSTVSCARCHDHKTDPITMRDYYSLYSIFDHTEEPEDKPVIGAAEDEAAFQAYQAESAKLDEQDRAVRQQIVDHVRSKEALPNYLELAWLARKEDWNHGKATSEGFKRNRLRPNALMRWKDFLGENAEGERLKRWLGEMDAAADDNARKALCEALAGEWLAAGEGSELAGLTAKEGCPLNYDVDRISNFMDVEDGNQRRARIGAKSKLMMEHPGSPPRAMTLSDKGQWGQAVIFERGNPAARGESFDRQWMSFLGGGKYADGMSPRLSLAEKITDPANPLTARVIVNRTWAWHFGAPLAEPGDFGPQTLRPELLELLDTLAVSFLEKGQSMKELHRLLLTSQAFRLGAEGAAENDAIDQANTKFWKWNRRRLDFETMRDRVLASSGALQTDRTGGRSINLDDPPADTRRSLYAFVDRYALPGTFVSFDLPHPDHHSPKRVETTVPQQALYFLNGPMVIRQAEKLASDERFKALPDDRARLEWVYRTLFRRAPAEEEMQAALDWIGGVDPADYAPKLGGYWEVRHAPDAAAPTNELATFPIFADGVWKTGPDPATAPIRWLNVAANGGHASAHHAMVLRWRATGSGQVKMSGHLKRTQEGGSVLAWRIDGKGHPLAEAELAPDSSADIESTWTEVKPGDTMDFVLRAPNGDSCGNVAWTLRIEGRESESKPAEEIGNFTRQFPKSNDPAPGAQPANPWADLVQMLWASNEFHFVD